MMKTTWLLAGLTTAVLAAMSAQTSAAEVEVYGTIDTGINFQHVDTDQMNSDAENKVRMNSSQTTPNRWGLRGSEEINSDLSVGFMLEGQYNSDDGTLMPGNRLFHRTSQISLKSKTYGTFIVGRSGALRSGTGSTGLWGPKVAPFSNSWGDYIVGSKYILPGSYAAVDNALTYTSPKIAGIQIHAQYSGQINQVNAPDDAEEFESSSDRYWAVAATYTNGPLYILGIVDGTLYADTATSDYRNSLTTSLAVNYQFTNFKLYGSGIWFSDLKGTEFLGHSFNGVNSLATGSSYKGYALQLGADIPAFGGTFKVNAGWMDAEIDRAYGQTFESKDTDRIAVGLGYTYPLSKRTTLYAGAGWTKDSSVYDTDPSVIEAISGLCYKF